MQEYDSRFAAANLELSIGGAESLTSRGVSVEIAEAWHWFKAARWSLTKRDWVLVNGKTALEDLVRHFLDQTLKAKP